MTNRNDNRERKNKYPNNKQNIEASKEISSIQQDPTPEENAKYGSKSHKN
ncbi:hypothetical protein JOC95_001345 [Bacillus tianshenii]|uniref:Glycogen biosynthesis protein GlgD n=1 Tax=Sutcliffiella tianshenii TaxID=1463404 RepID=A0ABS2NXU5_9BACI|nr:hypothetical protein [Bacillus tianshenii]MBM7619496.1 hypothetical protein [Bacillus tianshenii]